jgi:hypothetical protein
MSRAPVEVERSSRSVAVLPLICIEPDWRESVSEVAQTSKLR